MKKTRFALAGASGRAIDMYAKPILQKYNRTAELVAIHDMSQIRMDYYNKTLGLSLPTFTDMGKMLREADIDTVIVTTKDCVHHECITKALKAGKDVISEKPMTIDAEKVKAILKAEKQSGRKVVVTFNYRFGPPITAIREIISAGTIGEIVTVDMHWPLDLRHGANYFRRWHRRMGNSGGLQVHKSTHHFDLVNWLIQDTPVSVMAQGGLNFYGKNGPFRHKHCRGCPHKDKCQFFWDINKSRFCMDFYVAAEKESGYVRDGCVFDKSIDILDNYSCLVKYKNGARLAYSLQAFAPWEGYRLEIQGREGRLEFVEFHSEHDWVDTGDHKIEILLNDGTRIIHTPPKGIGGHGGGDEGLQKRLFIKNVPDPLGHMAGTKDAVNSVLVGVAATKSIKTGKWVNIADLMKG